MIAVNALVISNNMRNDSTGFVAVTVGIGLVAALVIVVALKIRRRWKERKKK